MTKTSSDRDEVLQAIKRSLELGGGPAAAAGFASDASAPKFDQAHFIAKLKEGGCEVAELTGLGELPAAVSRFCDEHGLDPVLALAPGELEKLDWQGAGLATTLSWSEDLKLAVTGSAGAIAETGQFVVTTDSQDSAFSLLAENHVVVIDLQRLHASLEDLDKLLSREPAGVATLVHGPSRTADIEQTLVMGAHGPCRVLACVVGPAQKN